MAKGSKGSKGSKGPPTPTLTNATAFPIDDPGTDQHWHRPEEGRGHFPLLVRGACFFVYVTVFYYSFFQALCVCSDNSRGFPSRFVYFHVVLVAEGASECAEGSETSLFQTSTPAFVRRQQLGPYRFRPPKTPAQR